MRSYNNIYYLGIQMLIDINSYYRLIKKYKWHNLKIRKCCVNIGRLLKICGSKLKGNDHAELWNLMLRGQRNRLMVGCLPFFPFVVMLKFGIYLNSEKGRILYVHAHIKVCSHKGISQLCIYGHVCYLVMNCIS